ncbi:MAG TPA: hypothetical protein VEJ16_11645, partial [Alphaproteobacteria bacterium]|nr:hypothetical protein [Alphaproteobacteria bacterium]
MIDRQESEISTNLPPAPYRLRLPGPTAVPECIRTAMAQPMLAHRGPEFSAILLEVERKLKPIFGTENRILMAAATGTGMMEACLVNVLKAGERILVVVNGQFGERFAAIGRALGVGVDTLEVPWGEAVDPSDIETRVGTHDYRAVVLVHNESSTGIVAEL